MKFGSLWHILYFSFLENVFFLGREVTGIHWPSTVLSLEAHMTENELKHGSQYSILTQRNAYSDNEVFEEKQARKGNARNTLSEDDKDVMERRWPISYSHPREDSLKAISLKDLMTEKSEGATNTPLVRTMENPYNDGGQKAIHTQGNMC